MLILILVLTGLLLGITFNCLGYTVDLPTYIFACIGLILGFSIIEWWDKR